MIKINFGSRIRQIRNNKGIRSKFIAGKLGMSPSGYCDIESGRRKLTIERALIIAELLGTDINAFIYGDNTRETRSLATGTES